MQKVEVRMGPYNPTIGLQVRDNPVCATYPGQVPTGGFDLNCTATIPAARYLSIMYDGVVDTQAFMTICELRWTFAPLP
jgi:hypothetical protein